MNYVESRRERSESEMFKHYVEGLASGFGWKIITSVILSSITGFYGDLIWGFLALFCLDWVTGISKSIYKGIPISSKRLRDSVIKLGAYMLLLTSLIITSRYESAFSPLVTVTYYYFIFTELKSILENVEEMGVHVPEAVKKLIRTKVSQDEKEEKK